jgi:signal peptidase I
MTERSTTVTGAEKTSSNGGLKDTIESILIAFVLAFIFRAFVVEAFVIPTGSMATTLLGAHMRFDCRDCGYRFDVNYQAQPEGEALHIPPFGRVLDSRNGQMGWRDHVHTALCPNCGYRVPNQQALNPPVHYGDRILVLKYLYLFQEPQRWDVVVFKSPAQPEVYQYTQNYIKRLVGKGGESVMLLDGDVYVQRGDGEAWQIQRKPRVVQESLWRVIYDNDFHPQSALPSQLGAVTRITRTGDQAWRQPWTQAPGMSGWTQDRTNPRVFQFNNMDAGSLLRFDITALPPTRRFTEWQAYNSDRLGGHTVTDLKLRLFHEREEGQGPLRLRMSKREHVFTAEIVPGLVRLLHQQGDGQATVVAEASAPGRGGPVQIEFMNVDYQVTLRVDGRTVIQHTYEPDAEALIAQYTRDESAPDPAIEIEASHQRSTIRHLSLWRDVYYLNRDSMYGRPFWGSPDQPIHLGADEFYVLGDNSGVSGDSRFWYEGIELPHEELYVDSGRVPRRFMLGKAFFVYWPAGYRPFYGSAPGIVPNFGDMRFIH